jgi:hypothetical protein
MSVSKIAILSGILLISSGPLLGSGDHESGMANKFDHDGDGKVTREEYDKAFENKMKTKLDWLDTNKDGVISPEEFRAQHQIEFDQRWATWDADGDGVVSVDAVLKQKQESRAEKKKTVEQKD